MNLNEAICILKKRQACGKDEYDECSEHRNCHGCPYDYKEADLIEAIDIVLKQLEGYKQAPC